MPSRTVRHGAARIGLLAKAALYGLLAILVPQESITAAVLRLPHGTWLVASAGVVIVAVSLALLRELRSHRYLSDLKPLPSGTRRAVSLTATTGITARTTVYSLAGLFLIRAAVRHDPNTGVGLDGALSQVAKTAHGTIVLVACAAGLVAYAVWCLVRARYEDVDRSDG